MNTLTQPYTIYPDSGRGKTEISWLKGRHTFSFGSFYDPERGQFGSLRVINDDRIAAKGGFPSHPHQNMEIISFVLEGALEHEDSMGNGDVINAGDVQYMSAGTGVIHSEFNPLADQSTRLIQVWITPDQDGYEPAYEKKDGILFSKKNAWISVLEPTGKKTSESAIEIRQDASAAYAHLDNGSQLPLQVEKGRQTWLQVLSGKVQIGDAILTHGDSIAIKDPFDSTLHAIEDAQLLRFNLSN
ncbi:MAG: pirin family protein [Verrucomicrobiota bacterium]